MKEKLNLQAVLFDLDGVLIDSGADIASSVNAALTHFGYKEEPQDTIISFVGDGAKNLLIRALGYQGIKADTMPNFSEFFDWYVERYRTHSAEKTLLYKGVYELLEKLREKGVFCAVVSNKPLSVTREILKHFSIDCFFDAVVGPEQLSRIKPAPEGLALAIDLIEKKRNAAIVPEKVLMVGDSATDIQAGRALGAHTCAVTEGFGDRKKLLAENADIVVPFAEELVRILF
ncbi:HAD-IA family hydrolase [Treponema sp. HNW]|uniref:HAD family hydrolase n=1 Tax=Treponema sp. HNW TaxID=3116654 RepID=UPI003D0A32B2